MLDFLNGIYVKAIVVVACVLAIFAAGFGLGYSRLSAYKLNQAGQAAKIEAQYQDQAAKIEKEKNDQIDAINSKLSAALIQLHNRPSRPAQASTPENGTGLSLYAQDASFLIWEAARADRLRTALEACYAQYDELK
jgi:hypothetical protein